MLAMQAAQARPALRVGLRLLRSAHHRPRSAQQRPRSAADTSPSSDPGQPLQHLEQEVASLSRMLQAPRINKRLVLSKLAVVAADLRAARADKERDGMSLEVAQLKMQASA